DSPAHGGAEGSEEAGRLARGTWPLTRTPSSGHPAPRSAPAPFGRGPGTRRSLRSRGRGARRLVLFGERLGGGRGVAAGRHALQGHPEPLAGALGGGDADALGRGGVLAGGERQRGAEAALGGGVRAGEERREIVGREAGGPVVDPAAGQGPERAAPL